MANKTTEIELIGIRIAATIGDRLPLTANNRPTILYKNEITKLIFITVIVLCESCMNLGKRLNFSASRIPSQAGENTLMFSEIAIPTLL